MWIRTATLAIASEASLSACYRAAYPALWDTPGREILGRAFAATLLAVGSTRRGARIGIRGYVVRR